MPPNYTRLSPTHSPHRAANAGLRVPPYVAPNRCTRNIVSVDNRCPHRATASGAVGTYAACDNNWLFMHAAPPEGGATVALRTGGCPAAIAACAINTPDKRRILAAKPNFCICDPVSTRNVFPTA